MASEGEFFSFGTNDLTQTAMGLSRDARPGLETGICGEPSSVEFCFRVGMDYVSCSPYRVPIAPGRGPGVDHLRDRGVEGRDDADGVGLTTKTNFVLPYLRAFVPLW